MEEDVTHHGPHAVGGGWADRVVVRVRRCIDSAIAGEGLEQRVSANTRADILMNNSVPF